MRRALGALALIALLAAAGGCARMKPPPLELSYRDSLVGAGKIVQIANTSSEALTGIRVTIEGPSGESRTFTQDELAGYQTLEIGWKKLGGWQISPGSEIEIAVDGHWPPFKGRLPEPGEQG